MILHQYNKNSYLDTKIKEFWSVFKVDILKLTNKSWKEEDYRGKTYTHWQIQQYYNALGLVLLLVLDIKKNGNVYTDWSYYNTKYKIDDYRKCLACACIDLDKILSIFGLPFEDCEGGIECRGIEITFEVEPDTQPDTPFGDEGQFDDSFSESFL